MVDRADVVVIGAGLGGLAAAVQVAGRGRRVIVLEQGSSPGGYATSFQRGPYRFDTSLHALNGLAPGGGVDNSFGYLGIADRMHMVRLDPLYLARFPGVEIRAHADRFRYEAELIEHFGDQSEGIRNLIDEQVAAHGDFRRWSEDRVAGRDVDLEGFVTNYPVLARLGGETAEQAIARFVSDPRLRAVLGSLWVYLGLPPSRLSAAIGAVAAASYHDYGGWYPTGGSAALSHALAEVLHERGGEIRFEQAVTTIEVTEGLATAVVTEAGQRVETDCVISNASAPTTLLEMVGRDLLPGSYTKKVESPTTSYTTFAVYLGLTRDVFAEHGFPHELFVFPSYDHDLGHAASLEGDWSHVPLLITDYTRVDPGCAPPGRAAVVVTTEAPWDYADVWGTGGDLTDYHTKPAYLAIKERVADALVARACTQLRGLAEAIDVQESSSPLTNFAYTRNPRGAIEGYENSPDNSGLGWLPQSTPVPNLYLAGAWTNSGGQTAAIHSGMAAGLLALRAASANV